MSAPAPRPWKWKERPRFSLRLLRVLGALAGFVRGFAGLESLPREPRAVRSALARRAAGRPHCC